MSVSDYLRPDIGYNASMQDHLLTFLFLLLAFVLYGLGMALPGAIFMVLGLLAEIVFWVRLFRKSG